MIRLSDWRILIGQTKHGLVRLRQSQFARDAALLMLLNMTSRAIGFFGSTYAFRCLGPVNLGVSSLVQTTATQVTLTYEGGFTTTGIRMIAADKANASCIAATIITFRMGAALVAAAVWILSTLLFAPEAQRMAWLLGAPALIFFAANITSVFQGLEKLPIQTAITTFGVLLSAAAYLILFKPGMFLGADLIVVAVVGTVTTTLAWSAYFRLFRSLPIGRVDWQRLRSMLRESRVYWWMSVIGTVYPAVQVFLLAVLLGPYANGVFRSALGIAGAVELLFSSVSSLILARLVVWRVRGPLFMWQRQSQLTIILAVLTLPIFIALVFTAPLIYAVLLGAKFRDGVLVFQIVIGGKFVVFLGQNYVYGLVAMYHGSKLLWIHLLTAALSMVLSILLLPLWGVNGAALSTLSTDVFYSVACYCVLKSSVRREGARS
jgi:O-antigen/teichoic acid export membrane protein